MSSRDAWVDMPPTDDTHAVMRDRLAAGGRGILGLYRRAQVYLGAARSAARPMRQLVASLAAYRRGGYNFGFIPAMGRLIMAHPGLAPGFGMQFTRVMFGPGALSRAEREMVAAVTAAAQDCFY